MKTIYHSHIGNSLPIGNIEIEVNFSANRELSEAENSLLSESINIFVNRFKKNSLLLDPGIQDNLKTYKQNIVALFDEPIYVQESKNMYNADSIYPWYTIVTKKGFITVGIRKWDIIIDWSESLITITGNEVTDDNITKGDRYIHASGYEKAKEYIDILMQH